MRKTDLFHFTGADSTWWLWIVGGALYGIALRFGFGLIPSDYRGTMSVAFLLATPFVLGALTVYGGRHKSQSLAFYIFGPWLAVALMLLGCAMALLEGSICLAIMSPLFFTLASFGGVTMGLALRIAGRNQSQLKAIVLLPLLILIGEQKIPLQEQSVELRQATTINASADTVWRQILSARSIRSDELPFSVSHFIGVPKPVEGVNVVTPAGEIRYSRWERGVNFRAIVTERQPGRSIRWHYQFDRDSFPAGSMDEHVEIGGRYFKLDDTTFNLEPLSGNRTRLEIVGHYRVSSSVNFYAVPMTKFLGNDFIRTILGLYKGRSERAERRAGQT